MRSTTLIRRLSSTSESLVVTDSRITLRVHGAVPTWVKALRDVMEMMASRLFSLLEVS
jgi:hypothetical protein